MAQAELAEKSGLAQATIAQMEGGKRVGNTSARHQGVGNSTSANIRKLKKQVQSLRQTPKPSLALEGTGVISSKVEGRVFSQAYRQEWSLNMVLAFQNKVSILN